MEFIFQGSCEKSLPKPIRILCLLVFIGVYGAIIVALMMVCLSPDTGRVGRILCGGVVALLVVFMVWFLIWKVGKGKKL